MSEIITYKKLDCCSSTFTRYTRSEIEAAWKTEGQGHQEAIEKTPNCVVIACEKETALRLSAMFVRNIFAIPTCTHYDGGLLYLFCGDSGEQKQTIRATMAMIQAYMILGADEHGPLFSDEKYSFREDKLEICKHCDHFVEPNDDPLVESEDLAKYLHLEDGEQEFDHDAEPSGQIHTGGEWEVLRPDLFKEHPDGKIGPNSKHHSRRGKDDSDE